MYNLFLSQKYVEQYNCAIENKFTYYGFTTIKNDFESIINKSINMKTPNSPITSLPQISKFNTIDNLEQTNYKEITNLGGKKTRKNKKTCKNKKTHKYKKTRKYNITRKHKRSK